MAKRKKRPVPIAPPPEMKSRKKARQVTSLFHKLTRQMEEAKEKGETKTVESLLKKIDEMGGREEYQRASQLSTKFHSTSRWVLKVLGRKGWLHGLDCTETETVNTVVEEDTVDKRKQRKKRCVRILEVGAINTELLDAAVKTKRVHMKKSDNSSKNNAKGQSPKNQNSVLGVKEKGKKDQQQQHPSEELQIYHNTPMYNISVRAIDLRSSHEQIEEQDFLTLPIPQAKFDVIVCSMVLNCVSTPADRGKMLSLLFEQLNPGGLCFFTVPKLCLSQSKYINKHIFEEMLEFGIGFTIEEKRDTPKVQFYVLLKNHGTNDERTKRSNDAVIDNRKKQWSELRVINRGKTYRNEFSVIL
mmetsp:Transcript_3009/g.3504  ORF Transcript_3009/g.3504 Transcript_3009/m.3504 type:complete len:357 (-) Transcript_3009:216-1286(-)